MKQIVPGVFCWSVFSQDKGLDFNGHLVLNGTGEAVAIDPPAPSASDLEALEKVAIPRTIVITNAHHARGATALAGRWKARVLVPRLDAARLPEGTRVDGEYAGGDLLPAGLRAIGLTGQKTPGETALLVEEIRVLVVGDAVIGKPPGRLSLLPPDKYADPEAARAGLKRLLDHPFVALLVGDGCSLPEGGRRALEDLLGIAS
ncbi:MAG: hypothetical protein ACREAA_21370 [Candidatus Polarisedimenticolia bacterium]